MSVVFLGGEVVSYYGIDAFTITQAVYGYYFTHHGAKDYIDCGFLVGSHLCSLICVVKGIFSECCFDSLFTVFQTVVLDFETSYASLLYILQCTVCTW